MSSTAIAPLAPAATVHPMVIAAAREMCRQAAAGRQVDKEHLWRFASELFISDARKVLKAASQFLSDEGGAAFSLALGSTTT